SWIFHAVPSIPRIPKLLVGSSTLPVASPRSQTKRSDQAQREPWRFLNTLPIRRQIRIPAELALAFLGSLPRAGISRSASRRILLKVARSGGLAPSRLRLISRYAFR